MIYLDHAATSAPKPPTVLEKMIYTMKTEYGNPGRGAHTMSIRAAERVYRCRERAASFFGASGAERVVFTMNTTYALNIAIKSIVHPGDHVLIGNMEHNSVLRPLEKLRKSNGVTYTKLNVRASKDSILRELRQSVQPNTRALVCAHVPNLANCAIPVAEIGAFCRTRGIIFILDAAQSAGHLPIDVERMQIDLLCVPGHKGLYGPQGCAMMVIGSHCPLGTTLIEGGSGIHSLDLKMPIDLPEHFEAGTLPTPAIAGLEEGLRLIASIGTDEIHAHECHLWHALYERLAPCPSIRIADLTPGAVMSFTASTLSPTAIAEQLDARGICVRAGYHCSPLGHCALGTEKTGAVRVSFGMMNTESEIDTLACALSEILDGA